MSGWLADLINIDFTLANLMAKSAAVFGDKETNLVSRSLMMQVLHNVVVVGQLF